MKKILIATTIAAMGIVANAAVANWSVDNIYVSGTSDYAEGYMVYYFDTSAITVAAVNSAIAAGDTSFISQGYAAASLTDDEGYTEGASASIYSANDAVNGYLVIFDSSSAASATHAYVTAVKSTTINSLGANAALSFGDLVATQTAGNWTAVAPEPTSGLLLLLGMAGLALKRKRA